MRVNKRVRVATDPLGPATLPSQSCPGCRSHESRLYLRDARDYITGEEFTVRRCLACGTGFTCPQPGEMGKYYPRRYREYVSPVRAALRALYGLRVWLWHREAGKPGRVLEVGCGSGWMLKAFADRGWTAVGVERGVQEVRQARVRFGLPVFVGDLGALRVGTQFDLVVMVHVLEHVPDPVAILRDCGKLLKPQGALVLAVPNLASWQARLFGRQWFHLDVPRHLVHFTPESLAFALVQAGFDVARFHFISAHDPYGWIQSTLNGMGFQQNLLTDLLMGRNRSSGAMLWGLVMAVVSLVLFLPSLLLSAMSWSCHAGALMEVRAVRRT